MALQCMGEISPGQYGFRGKFREFPDVLLSWDIPPMDDAEKIAAIRAFIRTAMNARGMSQRALSAAAGLSESAVRDVLGRTTNPGVGTLYKISEALGIPFDDMMAAGEGDGSANNLLAWRMFHKMTRADLAAACTPPTTEAVIQLLEESRGELSPKWLHRLAPALKTRPLFLAEIDPRKADTTTMELAMAVPEDRKPQVNAILETFLRNGTNN